MGEATNLLLLGVGTLAVGGLGYLAWQELNRPAIPALGPGPGPQVDPGSRPDSLVPVRYTPPGPANGGTSDPLGILGVLGGLAGTVPSPLPPGGLGALFPGIFGAPTIPPSQVPPLAAGVLAPVLPSEASVTVPNGGQILVAARTTAPELREDVALGLALTELYRQQAPQVLGFVQFVAAPQLPPAIAAYVNPLIASNPLGPPGATGPLAGARLYLGTLRAQPGAGAATYPRVATSPALNVESTILAARRA